MRATTLQSRTATTAGVDCGDLQERLEIYANSVRKAGTPNDVLDALDALVRKDLPLRVLAAVRFPVNDASWKSLRLGKSVFLHKDVPEGLWDEYVAVARGKFRPLLFMARASLADYTWTEVSRLLEPIGIDRWFFDLALKHGMRDGLTCTIGGRWVVAFWSRKPLGNVLTVWDRILAHSASYLAALRLEQLAGSDAERFGSLSRLTSRELAVLRLASTGAQTQEIARSLDLGEETIRSHLKKAQGKLGARSRIHATSEAIRHGLIP
jgi:LuxR family quorum sensing-dependent transcriptional regulator